MVKQFFRTYLLISILGLISFSTSGQTIDSVSFSLLSRQSFYTFEEKGEFLLHVPELLSGSQLSVNLNIGNENTISWKGIPGHNILRIPFSLKLKQSLYKIGAIISVLNKPQTIYKARTELNVLNYKPNEVKTDRYTGGLIVNKLPYFPFGFYCYSPVQSSLIEEEVVKGFNVISPYQRILPETLSERKAYMDRCAELGVKVHYNLLSVSGGGGVGSKIEGLDDAGKKDRLIEEIKTFRDHPALLGWYIADEPDGVKITAEQLRDIYKTVRENDPWHPVSIVFMAPFLSSRNYLDALDIVMADPYPIPDYPVTMTGDVAYNLRKEFRGKRPFWIIPQAFGGGEIWSREPTIQEIRTMTWQSIINGATGIQYFVRQGLNYFPKSSATWGECGRMAVEVAELTPWLLSDEEALPVVSSSKNILVTSKVHNGQLMIIAVNRINEPLSCSFSVKGNIKGEARVLFENRFVPVRNNSVSDHIAPYGSQVYMVSLQKDNSGGNNSVTNLLRDPGFEDLSTPGIPSACYARPGGDRGATYFLDTREHLEGNHSLRIITPVDNKSLAIRFFPITVRAGASYTISLWAKSDPEQRNFLKSTIPQYVEVQLGDFGISRFIPDNGWREYMTFISIPGDTLAHFKTNLILKMPGTGVGWFDQVKITEDK